MIEPSFICDKEVALILGVSPSTVSRQVARYGGLHGVRPVIIGRRRRWPRKEVERAFGLADDEPCGIPERGHGETHEPPAVMVAGRWRAEKPRPNRWGEPVKVYGLGGAAVD